MIIPRNFELAPPTPGQVLRELLFGDGQLTQDQAARAIGVSRYSVNQLVNDKRAVTAEMALRLAKAVDTSPEFWLDLQRNVDLYKAHRRLGRRLGTVRVLRRAPGLNDLFYPVED